MPRELAGEKREDKSPGYRLCEMQARSILLFLNKIHTSPQETLVGSWGEWFLMGSFHLWMEHFLHSSSPLFLTKSSASWDVKQVKKKYSLGPLIMLSYWVYKFDVKQARLNGIYLFQKYHLCEALLHHPIDLGIFVIVLDAFMKGRLLTN